MRPRPIPVFVAALLFGFCLLAWSRSLRAETPEEQRFRAADGVRLRADWWHGATPTARLILVLPGFAQNKATGTMRFVAGLLTPTADVMVLDLRGTGESDGEFSFGAEEPRDAQAALAWAKPRYGDVTLLGFSLGSYTALRACVEGPLRPQRGLLVSLPVRFEGVITSGGLWTFLTKGLWAQKKDVMAVPENADTMFRWGPLFLHKPKAPALAAHATLPLHFLVGAEDQLVFPWTSRLSYDAVPGTATWTSWPDGRHAEAMALKHPGDFTRWVRACMDFHGTGKRADPFGVPR
ncbi:MAG TPA: alpha/beta fold hydrolase [bacterium]|nr:alpha/beta fold hydrolase [bacterium]